LKITGCGKGSKHNEYAKGWVEDFKIFFPYAIRNLIPSSYFGHRTVGPERTLYQEFGELMVEEVRKRMEHITEDARNGSLEAEKAKGEDIEFL